jgi:UDP-N-acetylmuramate dehydrogenase
VNRIDQAAAILGDRARRDVPFGARTTYRVGGTAALGFEVGDADDLVLLQRALAASSVPMVVLGRGSNVLVSDRGFAGLLVWLGPWADEVTIEGLRVRAGAAVSLPVLARRTVAAGLTGMEWAVGVPGSVGGAVRMNAGGHGADMAGTLSGVRVYDLHTGEDGCMSVDQLGLDFRHSALTDAQIVVSATFDLARGDRVAGEAELAEIVRWRREHQPGGQNAGSVFVNPRPVSAGELIDTAGLRGTRVGSAEVSSKHANFIQCDEGGSAEDVAALMGLVRDRVAATSGVLLRSEVRLVGFQVEP